MSDYPAGDVQTALRDNFVPNIVVAQDIEERNIILGTELGQIFRGQIATAEHQVYGTRFDRTGGADKVGHDYI
jgi:hypothetical protein